MQPRLKATNANAKTAYNAAAEALTDMETQGVQIGATWNTGEVDCTSVGSDPGMPTSDANAVAYLEYCLTKNLGPNGKDGGFAWVGTDTNSTADAPVYYAQWHKTTSDDIKGQYPEAPATVAISQGMTFGSIYHVNQIAIE